MKSLLAELNMRYFNSANGYFFYFYTVIANCWLKNGRMEHFWLRKKCRGFDILSFFNQNITVKFSCFEKFSYICGGIH